MRKVSDKTLIKRALDFKSRGSSSYCAVYFSFQKSRIFNRLRFCRILKEIEASVPNTEASEKSEVELPIITGVPKKEPKLYWWQKGQYA